VEAMLALDGDVIELDGMGADDDDVDVKVGTDAGADAHVAELQPQ